MSAPESVTITLPPGHGDWKSVAEWLRKPDYATHNDLADQIEAQLPKPKPSEPKGLGAVVKDRNGDRWVHADLNESLGWLQILPDGYNGVWAGYSAIDVVEVLSEGVTA